MAIICLQTLLPALAGWLELADIHHSHVGKELYSFARKTRVMIGNAQNDQYSLAALQCCFPLATSMHLLPPACVAAVP